ncbi:MAG: hypothetical protein ABEH65_09205 [Halobacteriales archaeon]
MTTYYDIVLGIIPLTLVGAVGAGMVAGIATTTAIAAGTLIAIPCLLHALFINPPIDPEIHERSTSTTEPTERPSATAELAD